MNKLNITELRAEISTYMRRVELSEQPLLITRNNKSVAALVPISYLQEKLNLQNHD
jgi:prevent-host-death family protein